MDHFASVSRMLFEPIRWNGPDDRGYKHGRYFDGSKDFSIVIAVPGLGTHDPHKTKVLVNGREIGESNSLQGAIRMAEKYFRHALHKSGDQDRTRSRGR